MAVTSTYTCDLCHLEYPVDELHNIDFKMDWSTSDPIFLSKMICHDCLKARLAHFTALGVTGGYMAVLAAEPA